MANPNLRIDLSRLLNRIAALAEVGAIEGGGVCRLALSDEDKVARDRVVGWMRDAGLDVTVDRIGNVIGVRQGRVSGPPVMTGSHIDSVRTGGRYDGPLGVLGGLGVIETLNDADITTEHPLAVAFFTNEEGSRFAPDMMGSLGYVGGMGVDAILATEGIDGTSVGENLTRIGYAGAAPVGDSRVRAFVELHVEQGPVLEQEGVTIGAVEGVQGISWTEYTLSGISNHAGTTPMSMRHDAGYAAAAIAVQVRRIAEELGAEQVGTVGALDLAPNLVNVVPNHARLTVDLRNSDDMRLREAEQRLNAFVAGLAETEGVRFESRSLARFEPVHFDPEMIARVEAHARDHGYNVKRMPSGAGHDAQMLARVCPTSMIFVPSVDGISHNVSEYTHPEDIEAGANVLLSVLTELAGR